MRFVGVSLLFLASAGPVSSQTITPEQWREDLQILVATLEAEHADLYHSVARDVFRATIDSLAARVASLDENVVRVELARILATVGDGHTLVNLAWDSRLPFRWLPVRFERASDGLVILETTSDFAELRGARVLRIGRLGADSAVAAIRPLFSRDNEWTSLQGIRYLLHIADVLHAGGVSESADSVELDLETAGGGRRRVTLPALARDEARSVSPASSMEAAPLWLRNREDSYWFVPLPEHDALYVQFNRADRDKEDETLAEFGRRMEQWVRDHDVERLIIDLRWNAGGNRWRARHLLNAVVRVEGHLGAERGTRDRAPRGRVFTIIGPNTFSAAAQFALDLDLHTNTVFVGEPTGGKPNHYGELGRFRLPNSGLEIRFSRFYHQASDPFDTRPAIFPDVPALPSVEDFRAGRDRALEAIRSYRSP